MPPSKPRPRGVSVFEAALCRGGELFLSKFFIRWPPDVLYSIFTLNYAIHSIVSFYIDQAWDPSRSLYRWFWEPTKLLLALHTSNAVICGSVALKYFDRNFETTNNVDICVRLDGLTSLGRVIIGNGFAFCPATGDPKNFEVAVLMQSGKREVPNDGQSTTSRRADPHMRTFLFVRCTPLPNGHTDTVTVTVHLVRWEPLRFILCSDSTAVVNVITGKCAISVFPQQTFIMRLAIGSSQHHETTNSVTSKWLEDYHPEDFRRVKGGKGVIRSLRTGRRYIGDSFCWSVHFERHSKAFGAKLEIPRGPSFEVLDWRTGAPREGAYVRLADPFVWSSWAYVRGLMSTL